MKKVLLSTAILGSLILGVVAPVTANAAVQQSQRVVNTKYVYCSVCRTITPHDNGDDDWSDRWICRICDTHTVG